MRTTAVTAAGRADEPGDAPDRGDAPHVLERVLLVGFMASGKTSVGRRLAEDLGWRFLDFDTEVERRRGRSIPAIFREEGEAPFRREEARTGAELLRERRVVLAAGGGWPCVEGRLDELDPATLSVWLQVDSATALERARHDPTGRPLLEGPDPEGRAAELLAERARFYRKARLHVETRGRTPSEIAREIRTALPARPADPSPS